MLLSKAQDAGLELMVEGDRLKIKGPRSAEALAKELLAQKWQVIHSLNEQRFFHERYRMICEAMNRIAEAYVPGTIEKIKGQTPALWSQIQETEREVDHACQFGDAEELRDTLSRLEELWREAILIGTK